MTSTAILRPAALGALSLAAALTLTGCAETPATSSPSGPQPLAVYPEPLAVPSPYRYGTVIYGRWLQGRPPEVSSPSYTPGDLCGASEMQGLVGRPRTEIPVPIDLSRRRVVCTTCPTTRDYRPDRLTIYYDLPTGRVTRLTCG